MALNPLLADADRVLLAVDQLKSRARKFYHAVQLSRHRCPNCDGALRMTGPSQCSCTGGHSFDPTLYFQRCACQHAAPLRQRQRHYACVACGRTVPSDFLFDERLTDAAYFRDRMREHRASRAQKRREVARFFRERSSPAPITFGTEQHLAKVFTAVDVMLAQTFTSGQIAQENDTFDLPAYASHILAQLARGPRAFTELPPLGQGRVDTVRRFMTLMVLSQERSVEVEQFGKDILVSLR